MIVVALAMAKSEEGMVKSNSYLNINARQQWVLRIYSNIPGTTIKSKFGTSPFIVSSTVLFKNNQNARLFDRPLALSFPASQVSPGSLIPQVPLGMEARSMAE